jgi:hypothetical protein
VCLIFIDTHRFVISGATPRDRTRDLLITKCRQRFQDLRQPYTEVPFVGNLGKLLRSKSNSHEPDSMGLAPVLTHLSVAALLDRIDDLVHG